MLLTKQEPNRLKMRILIYGINYAPELTGIGKYSGENGELARIEKPRGQGRDGPPLLPGMEDLGGIFRPPLFERERAGGG